MILSTSCPPLKSSIAGIPLTLLCCDIVGLSSTLSFVSVAFPLKLFSNFSYIGPSILHGPHQSA